MFDAHWIDQDGIQALTKLMKTTYLSCFLYNVMLKSKKKAVKEIKNCLETKRQELVRFDDKIRASQQNRGHLIIRVWKLSLKTWTLKKDLHV